MRSTNALMDGSPRSWLKARSMSMAVDSRIGPDSFITAMVSDGDSSVDEGVFGVGVAVGFDGSQLSSSGDDYNQQSRCKKDFH